MGYNINRDYEVSIWTLQDEFITVLKPSLIEYKGQIEEAKLVLSSDGTEEFNFSIPMYIYNGKNQITNPIWKNTLDGTIIQDMRKVKVTFNKTDLIAKKTFEFLIVDIIERHSDDQLYCDVRCEGLAFHELGKRGYKISLSSEDFYAEDYDWFISDEDVPEPKATIQYWLNKFLKPRPSSSEEINSLQWYYDIQMDWSSYSYAGERSSQKVYEEAYVKSWDDNLHASEVSTVQEKERMVDLEESNIYNLTQKIAEIFGVFCRYGYEYDANLHIISKTIIFYNNYLNEKMGAIDLTYPYATSEVTRERDSNDITTKMYVQPVDNEYSDSGITTIMDVSANKSGEDYLLNFDYMHSVGGISTEQYQEITEYEKKLRIINQRLTAISENVNLLNEEIPKIEGQITTYKNSEQLDLERISENNDLLNSILNKTAPNSDGVITINLNNPRTGILLEQGAAGNNQKYYYLNLTEKGIILNSIAIYKKENNTFLPITNWRVVQDNYGNVIKINYILESDNLSSKIVYITYRYSPQLYYESIKQMWENKLNNDRQRREEAENKYTQIVNYRDELINGKEENDIHISGYNDLLQEKKQLIQNFDDLMGAALRESYWQPENYNDYGDNYKDELSMPYTSDTIVNGNSNFSQFFWDQELFTDEQGMTWVSGIEENAKYYPAIDLSSIVNSEEFKANIDRLSFSFFDFDYFESVDVITGDTISNIEDFNKLEKLTIFTVGSQVKYGFVKKSVPNTNKYTIIPVMILTGIESLNIDSLKRLSTTNTIIDGINHNLYHPRIGVISSGIVDNSLQLRFECAWDVWQAEQTTEGHEQPYVSFINIDYDASMRPKGVFLEKTPIFPRIKIKSLKLKLSDDMLGIKYGGVKLENFEDYYVLSRHKVEVDEDEQLVIERPSFFITLKPHVILAQNFINNTVASLGQTIEVKFNLSNADTSIYLSAVEVLKENSQPKVSYAITPNIIDKNLFYSIYSKLNYICNINDTELQFRDVRGYISQIEIDCNSPENDRLEIKNYKTKFEDLFSTIVAQTEAMQKNAYTFSIASSAFSDGKINDKVLQNSLDQSNIKFNLNNEKLKFNETDGIIGESDQGAISLRYDGFYKATEKNENGEWIWQNLLGAQGINASGISFGQIDTNLINIFAGDQMRLQLNKNGLFAYKFEDESTADFKQFVTVNEDGLFLKASTVVIPRESDDDLIVFAPENSFFPQVEIGWNGLIVRKPFTEDNVRKAKPIFYVNMDGELSVEGTIMANRIVIRDNDNNDFSGMDNHLNNFISTVSLSALKDDSNHRLVTDNEKISWNSKYSKPTNGIPKTDFTSAVQTTLDKADISTPTLELNQDTWAESFAALNTIPVGKMAVIFISSTTTIGLLTNNKLTSTLGGYCIRISDTLFNFWGVNNTGEESYAWSISDVTATTKTYGNIYKYTGTLVV